MNVSELITALQSSPPESSIAVRLADGSMCPVSALHIGAGGDAAGTTWLECAPQNSDAAGAPEDDMSGMDEVDSMAMKAGVDIGKGKPKPGKPAVVPDDADEDDM